jgi:hypothetical protein
LQKVDGDPLQQVTVTSCGIIGMRNGSGGEPINAPVRLGSALNPFPNPHGKNISQANIFSMFLMTIFVNYSLMVPYKCIIPSLLLDINVFDMFMKSVCL